MSLYSDHTVNIPYHSEPSHRHPELAGKFKETVPLSDITKHDNPVVSSVDGRNNHGKGEFIEALLSMFPKKDYDRYNEPPRHISIEGWPNYVEDKPDEDGNPVVSRENWYHALIHQDGLPFIDELYKENYELIKDILINTFGADSKDLIEKWTCDTTSMTEASAHIRKFWAFVISRILIKKDLLERDDYGERPIISDRNMVTSFAFNMSALGEDSDEQTLHEAAAIYTHLAEQRMIVTSKMTCVITGKPQFGKDRRVDRRETIEDMNHRDIVGEEIKYRRAMKVLSEYPDGPWGEIIWMEVPLTPPYNDRWDLTAETVVGIPLFAGLWENMLKEGRIEIPREHIPDDFINIVNAYEQLTGLPFIHRIGNLVVFRENGKLLVRRDEYVARSDDLVVHPHFSSGQDVRSLEDVLTAFRSWVQHNVAGLHNRSVIWFGPDDERSKLLPYLLCKPSTENVLDDIEYITVSDPSELNLGDIHTQSLRNAKQRTTSVNNLSYGTQYKSCRVFTEGNLHMHADTVTSVMINPGERGTEDMNLRYAITGVLYTRFDQKNTLVSPAYFDVLIEVPCIDGKNHRIKQRIIIKDLSEIREYKFMFKAGLIQELTGI